MIMKQIRLWVGSGVLGCAVLMAQAPATAWTSAAATAPQTTGSSAASAAPRHVFIRVQSSKTNPSGLHGRLLIFIKQGHDDTEVDLDEFHPASTWVAAKEVTDLDPGQSVEVDADEIAFPRPFSAMPAGDYEAQAVLDTSHAYNYGGRSPSDWISSVVPLVQWKPGSGAEPVLTLTSLRPPNPKFVEVMEKAKTEARADGTHEESLVSPLLSAFWGKPVAIKAWVVLPPGYAEHPAEHYPTAYWTHGFTGNLDYALQSGLRIYRRMAEGKMPQMIWVMLDESCPQGTHEFADSVNNGPWGAALTTEFIPYLEKKYRMDGKPSGRLLNGHSSGGWATLQLEVNYPQVFGGTWSTSPDPSDFHDFTGTDLYATHANVYRERDGTATPIMREGGKVMATFEQFAKLEAVLGPYGGQVSSFDWVFSPKGDGGAPVPMFDRETGVVNPLAVAYWHDHYDLAHLVETRWPTDGSIWRGRFHLLVGTADTFYLDGAAHKFEAVLSKLDAQPHFTYIPGRTHFDLYKVGEDREGLFDQIGAEMYSVARPGVAWKAAH
jgi:enterochelin esterase-like enzyme